MVNLAYNLTEWINLPWDGIMSKKWRNMTHKKVIWNLHGGFCAGRIFYLEGFCAGIILYREDFVCLLLWEDFVCLLLWEDFVTGGNCTGDFLSIWFCSGRILWVYYCGRILYREAIVPGGNCTGRIFCRYDFVVEGFCGFIIVFCTGRILYWEDFVCFMAGRILYLGGFCAAYFFVAQRVPKIYVKNDCLINSYSSVYINESKVIWGKRFVNFLGRQTQYQFLHSHSKTFHTSLSDFYFNQFKSWHKTKHDFEPFIWPTVINKKTCTACFSTSSFSRISPEPLELQKLYLQFFISIFKELSAATIIFQIRWHDQLILAKMLIFQ